ncbi:uncharacterized protein EI97DRAFT_1855 [Westerdykella ornata]|uniref:PHD-type domain-containing protein n=1 Tax=Westerdykella ornata TaxID=318751 RepID=A0A6A6JXX4_WESOR|nr:uncharacterized protein EI97DRAFT_1855 [Westerdykella ornata]KAF2280596.1 hypothetical protein EI97DRAFT_1855 [Westerdykella ornata]
MDHQGLVDAGLRGLRKRTGGLSVEISPPPLKRQRSLAVPGSEQGFLNGGSPQALLRNSTLRVPTDSADNSRRLSGQGETSRHSIGESSPCIGTGNCQEARRPSTASTASRSGKQRCNQCGQPSAPRYDPFVKCSSCETRFHDRCRKPSLKENEDCAQWRCFRCIAKNRTSIASHPANHPHLALQNPLQEAGRDVQVGEERHSAEQTVANAPRDVLSGAIFSTQRGQLSLDSVTSSEEKAAMRRSSIMNMPLPNLANHGRVQAVTNGLDSEPVDIQSAIRTNRSQFRDSEYVSESKLWVEDDGLFMPFQPMRQTTITVDADMRLETEFHAAFPDLSGLSIHNMSQEEKDLKIMEIRNRPSRKATFGKTVLSPTGSSTLSVQSKLRRSPKPTVADSKQSMWIASRVEIQSRPNS